MFNNYKKIHHFLLFQNLHSMNFHILLITLDYDSLYRMIKIFYLFECKSLNNQHLNRKIYVD